MAKLVCLFILLILFFSPSLAKADTTSVLINIGDEAPSFALPTLDQKYLSLRDLCGKKLRKPWRNKIKHVVVLSFFATWCKPCLKEIPHLEEVMEKYSNDPVKIFLIDVGEEREKIVKLLESTNIKIPILIDRYNKTAEKYDALTLPRLIVIDKEGIIQKEQKGFSNADQFKTDIIALLNDLLNKN